MIRNIIGQSESGFNFREVMDQKKILLISLAKGKIGEDNAAFLGLILVPRILAAAMSRQDIPEDKRRDFYRSCLLFTVSTCLSTKTALILALVVDFC